MFQYINQVAEFRTLDTLNTFLESLPSEMIIRISSYNNGYMLIYKEYKDIKIKNNQRPLY